MNIYIMGWLAFGVITMWMSLYYQYRDEDKIIVSDILFSIWLTALGPCFLIALLYVYIRDLSFWHKPIIKRGINKSGESDGN